MGKAGPKSVGGIVLLQQLNNNQFFHFPLQNFLKYPNFYATLFFFWKKFNLHYTNEDKPYQIYKIDLKKSTFL